MPVKLTVVYGNPTDQKTFDQHYQDVHVPLASALGGVRKAELAKVFPKEDGSPTPAYRVAELWFDDYASACAAIATDAGQQLVADAQQLGAGGGVQLLLCDVEYSA